jgi:hypothetical protein
MKNSSSFDYAKITKISNNQLIPQKHTPTQRKISFLGQCKNIEKITINYLNYKNIYICM